MLSDKKFDRIEKILEHELLRELELMDQAQLNARIAQAEGAIKQAKDELEANEKYQELKEGIKALSAGLKDVRKRQKAIVEYSLNLKEEMSE